MFEQNDKENKAEVIKLKVLSQFLITAYHIVVSIIISELSFELPFSNTSAFSPLDILSDIVALKASSDSLTAFNKIVSILNSFCKK